MKFSHVNPEEALQIHKDIKSERSFGIHWATFKLTQEFYLEPKTRTVELVKSAGMDPKEFQVLDIGGLINAD